MNPDTPLPLIVLVEDEEHLARGLLFNLEAEGFRTHHEVDGDSAMAYLLDTPQSGPEKVGVIVLDCMLPGRDGFAITRALREAQRYTPILMLTARTRPEDILEGLEAGADDYLPKPFELNILIVRIKSLLRRSVWHAMESKVPAEAAVEPALVDTFHFNHRTIRFDALELVAPNRITQLTLMEAELLRYFAEREGKIIPRSEILEKVWHVHADTDTRAIDNFVVRLRRYIEDDPANPQHLTTVRGVGYRFLAEP
ncbi:MAG TPA: response regulator transcription factor [Acidobacteriaceae bacterium]|nr:response regulator transcription factor [Acidobacteriaceae bacterium]